jgi:hypothetical protein
MARLGHRRAGGRRARRAALAVLAGALAAFTLAPSASSDAARAYTRLRQAAATRRPALARVSPADRQATYAYLNALYAYMTAKLASAPASVASVEGLGGRLGAECSGVMANAPSTQRLQVHEQGPGPSPREVGEANREQRQRDELLRELQDAALLASVEPYREAALAFAAKLKALRWSNEYLTLVVRLEAASFIETMTSPPPDVCADMKAWAASGYRTLSSATKAFARARRELTAPLERHLRHETVQTFAQDPLARSEGPRALALVHRIEALRREQEQTLKPLFAAEQRLRSVLGIVEAAPPPQALKERSAKESFVIGHGRTAAGTSYTIRLQPKPTHPAPGESSCSPSIEIDTAVHVSGSGSRAIGESSTGTCLPRGHPEPPSVQCEGGLLVVQAQTGPRTRVVRLQLSNGRRIVSWAAFVPARLGGPVGYYYQEVRGPSPMPVSLTEFDAHGKELHTAKLPRVPECTANPIHYTPGGLRTLVRARAPRGPAFTIMGKRYRFLGHLHFKLDLELAEEERAFGLSGESEIFGGFGSVSRPGPFNWEMQTGCSPHEWAILYGLLTVPGDVVLARSEGALQPFRRVPIPPSLHAHGVLAYIALPAVPTELLVRAPGGRRIFRESLARSSREKSEECAGEAEGPS